MTALQRVTGLDRTIDPRLPSNLFALLASLAAGVIVAVQRGSILEIVAGAGWVFASWALGRELDPDRPLTAALTSSAALIALLGVGEAHKLAFPALSATGLLMIAARAGLNSTGRALQIGDEIVIATAPLIAQLLTGLPLGILGISSLTALYVRRGAWWSMALALVGIAGAFLAPTRDGGVVLVAVALLALGGLSLLRSVPKSQNDHGGSYDLQGWRVMQAGIWAGAAIAALLAPPLIWGSLAVTGVLAMILERLKPLTPFSP